MHVYIYIYIHMTKPYILTATGRIRLAVIKLEERHITARKLGHHSTRSAGRK
jgi:hypothetical protein